MLANLLNTNEVKDRLGAEKEFSRISSNNRETEFALVGEIPSQPTRLYVKHAESGSGMKRRRQSVVMFRKTQISDVDNVTPCTGGALVKLDLPVGAMASQTLALDLLAFALSFCATTGAATTVLLDGTGNGAKCLINGDL